MRFTRIVALALIAMAMMAVPAAATTLIRKGLEALTDENDLIVHGQVVDIHSYWNDDHTFILTDVRVRPGHLLKGAQGRAADLTFTVRGGTVGPISTLIVGGPDLVPGMEYVLFLNRDDLPGAPRRLGVRDLSQGVFQVRKGRAFSQAHGHPLLPDAAGRTEAPGGEGGLALDEMVRQVRQLAGTR